MPNNHRQGYSSLVTCKCKKVHEWMGSPIKCRCGNTVDKRSRPTLDIEVPEKRPNKARRLT